jgi:ATP-binding cassette, subfamily B, bacterial
MDCGPTCIRMVANYYGKNISAAFVNRNASVTREGVSILGLSQAGEAVGFETLPVRLNLESLNDVPLPCILHWNSRHFVVLHKIRRNRFYIADPTVGSLKYKKAEFEKCWLREGTTGAALLLEPKVNFKDIARNETELVSIKSVLGYLRPHKLLISQLFLGLLIASGVQLLFPFFTQSIIDVGINGKDVQFIYLVLAGQIFLFAGRTIAEFIRGWILIHLSTKVNISVVSDFLGKLFKLPIAFFARKTIGDLLRRIDDHNRIEKFLSSSSISAIFSLLNLVVFGVVLVRYHRPVFFVFLILSCAYVGYTFLFLSYRRKLDYKRFQHLSFNQGNLIQIIEGIQDIKINECEQLKKKEWEDTQRELFAVNVSSIKIQQYQDAGALFINELKNIIITVMTALAVIHGEMTIGMMLAVQYIIGQLNAPVTNLITFIREYQDAMLGLERINEIHKLQNEEEHPTTDPPGRRRFNQILIKGMSFKYETAGASETLRDISVAIPFGKTTAIVGASGSGKTTLLKILVKFYAPTKGSISVDDTDFESLTATEWRRRCGVVMQDGYLFSDTIARNIALATPDIDRERLLHAARVANIDKFVTTLPAGFDTTIGFNGLGLSQGQKQRILIARAVYKDPDILFFDEATSSLDASNETEIMRNLEEYLKGKTVIVIAHRLSTVAKADQILVMDNGSVVECGTHDELISKEGVYFKLVKNQLELITE